MAEPTTIKGTVQRVAQNGFGFLLSGYDGWLNLSKRADPRPTIPPAGTSCVVEIDEDGYVRAISTNGSSPQRPPATQASAPVAAASASRELIRIGALRAAATFLA